MTTTQVIHLSDVLGRCWSYQDPKAGIPPTTVEDCLRRTPWDIFKQCFFKFLPGAAQLFGEDYLDGFARDVATRRVKPGEGVAITLDNLHNDGATDLILAALWRERPDACSEMHLPKPAVQAVWLEPKEPTIPVTYEKAADFLKVKDARTVKAMADRGEIRAAPWGRKIILDCDQLLYVNPEALKEARP